MRSVSTLKCALFLLSALITSNSMLAGGGWVKSLGSGYYKLGFSTVTSRGYFDGGNLYNPLIDSRLNTVSYYMEHGIADGVSWELYAPLYTMHSVSGSRISSTGSNESVSDAASGIGDFNIGLRFKIMQKDFLAISSTVTMGVPVGSAQKGERQNLFTGDDEFNQILRFDASVPFGSEKIAGYTTVYGGINRRESPFSDEWLYGAEAGISHTESRLWLIGRINSIKAQNETITAFSNSFTQSMSFSTYMAEAIYGFNKKKGLSVSYTGSLSGNVLLVAPTYSIGLYINIDN